MTVLAQAPLDLADAEQPGLDAAPLPRVLRAVPTDPPYDEPDHDGTDPFTPLALVLPRRVDPCAFALPMLAGHAAGEQVVDPDERIVEAELRRLFGRRRTARCDLPAPGPRAATVVRTLLEVVAGDRPVRQVASWVSPRVLAGLEHRSPEQRTALGRRPMLRSVRVTEPADAVAEISAVVALGQRVRAVALRLEGLDGRWTVTALHVG
jgi:hypothetical protein